jgi:pimeloyl-ACP methyl ester carboxylesterase
MGFSGIDVREAAVGQIVKVATTTLALVAFLALAGCSQSDATPLWKTHPRPAALPTPDESGLMPIDDIQMWYAIFNKGGGDPVLLIHGGLVNADSWGNQVPSLAQNHEVIIADSRGHGRSTHSSKPFSYELMANDYLALLDRLNIDDITLVGWSDGGILALDIAMRYPARVTKLWVFGANTNLAGLKPNFDQDPVFAAVIAEAGEDYRRVSPTPNEYDKFLGAISKMWNTQPDYKPEEIAKIVAPTVVAVGEYDEAVKREHTEEIARLIPGAKLMVMSEVSHFAGWQNPDLYNRELMAFLDSSDG